MLNNCIVLLTCTRKESRNVNKRHDRNIESIAETNETCCLTACIYVEYTSISCLSESMRQSGLSSRLGKKLSASGSASTLVT